MARCLPRVESTDASEQKPAHVRDGGVASSIPFQVSMPKARLDKEAPDFVAEGFYQNQFQEFKLSDLPGTVGCPLLLSGGFYLCLTNGIGSSCFPV